MLETSIRVDGVTLHAAEPRHVGRCHIQSLVVEGPQLRLRSFSNLAEERRRRNTGLGIGPRRRRQPFGNEVVETMQRRLR